MNAPLPTSVDAYRAALLGQLYGIMSWAQLSAFWEKVDTEADWFVYAVGETPPTVASTPFEVKNFLTKIDALLRKEHEEDYCGIVYADDLEHPSFVKIYDPNHLGSSCGSSKTPPVPGWTLSRMPPTEIVTTIIAQNRRRWWQSFLDSLRG